MLLYQGLKLLMHLLCHLTNALILNITKINFICFKPLFWGWLCALHKKFLHSPFALPSSLFFSPCPSSLHHCLFFLPFTRLSPSHPPPLSSSCFSCLQSLAIPLSCPHLSTLFSKDIGKRAWCLLSPMLHLCVWNKVRKTKSIWSASGVREG